MKVHEAIALLQQKAGDLPDGLDAELRVVMCDGDDTTISRTLEIDTMVRVDKQTMSKPSAWWVIVKGHPHLDEGGPQRMRGIAADADEHLREWESSRDDGDESHEDQ